MTEKPRNAMQAVLDRAAQAATAAGSPSGAPSDRRKLLTSSRLDTSNDPRARTPG